MSIASTKRAFAAIVLLGFLLYCAGVPQNPPGFYIDESSVSYNAYTISQHGHDEFGVRCPIFFRAFGEYKNPIYIYLLAAVFRITGPSILVARLFSATLGVLAALLLGLLAARVAKRGDVGLLVAASALLTPWLFELSRLVLEVAIYPLAVVLLLLNLQRTSDKTEWSWLDSTMIAAALALLTYSYSIGRLLAPLLALGLLIFTMRVRLVSVFRVWLLYAASLVPLVVFHWRHPGALTWRFQQLTYVTPASSYPQIAWEFIKHYFSNISPWRMLVTGDPHNQIVSIYGMGHILFATFGLFCLGLFLIWRDQRRDPWWRYIIYGLLVSIVPAAMTKDYFHVLRLAAVPVFIVVLTIPAFVWILSQRRRSWLGVVLAALLVQAAVVHWYFHANGQSAKRRHDFDADFPQSILVPALMYRQPIYIADSPIVPGYIQSYWHATLRDEDLSRLVKLRFDEAPPAGGLVITTEETCGRCEVLAKVEPYMLYVSSNSLAPLFPLPDGAFRAAIELVGAPPVLPAKRSVTLQVRITNLSDTVWPAAPRTVGEYHVSLGNHWLTGDGEIITNDDGRTTLKRDVAPGEIADVSLTVTTPATSGRYLLELDMVQEGVSWFGLKGSQTARLPVTIE